MLGCHFDVIYVRLGLRLRVLHSGFNFVSLEQNIGFLGFGNMGQAIGNGLLDSGEISHKQLVLYDLCADNISVYGDKGAILAQSLPELVQVSDVLLLATKPQDMEAALGALEPDNVGDILYISIAAGLSISLFEKNLGASARIVRVMPNTPAMVGAGAAAYALNDACTASDEALVSTIFGSVGLGLRVLESSFDAVTALSGSGPAYYFYFVECFMKAGVELGLSEEQATELAVQTLYGAGKMLKETKESAATLRENVTSKGGTTFAALESFRGDHLEKIVFNAMKAASERSRELGK
jgi:pyrroline-5-carboxylate reductase